MIDGDNGATYFKSELGGGWWQAVINGGTKTYITKVKVSKGFGEVKIEVDGILCNI